MTKAFLVAASMAVASAAGAGGDDLAFYPFADGANGVRAANDFVITNAVDGSLYGGVVTNAVGWTGGVFFTNAVPGRYLFDGEGYHAAPYASDFGAVFIGGRNNNDGSAFTGAGSWSARVSFDSLAAALHDEDHWTVEFFYFLPANQFIGYKKVISLDPGYAYNGTPVPINLMPTGKDNWQWRVQTSSNTYGIFNASTSYYDRWMHIALVYDNGSLAVYLDYTKKVTLAYTKAEAVQNAPLNLSDLSARGAFCGLRVMRRALASTEFLRASDHPTQIDRTAFEWPLEEAAGASVPAPLAYDDSGDVGLGAPVYVARKEQLVFEGDDAAAPARTSSVAVALSIAPKASSSDLFAYGQGLCLPAGSIDRILGDFTMEAFMKFDKDEWESKVANHVIDGVGEPRKRLSLFGQKFVTDGSPTIWSFGLNFRDGVYRPLLSAILRNGNTNVSVSHEDSGVAVTTDGKWHHYAVTYDSATYTMTAYEDGRALTSTVFDYPLSLGLQQTQTAYYVGAGRTLSGHPFVGEVDEVRLSRCVLPPSEFLRMSPVPSGLILIFR